MSHLLQYRKLVGPDSANIKCAIMLPNQMQCPRHATRFIVFSDGDPVWKCEGHFQVQLQQYNEQVRLHPDQYQPAVDLDDSRTYENLVDQSTVDPANTTIPTEISPKA